MESQSRGPRLRVGCQAVPAWLHTPMRVHTVGHPLPVLYLDQRSWHRLLAGYANPCAKESLGVEGVCLDPRRGDAAARNPCVSHSISMTERGLAWPSPDGPSVKWLFSSFVPFNPGFVDSRKPRRTLENGTLVAPERGSRVRLTWGCCRKVSVDNVRTTINGGRPGPSRPSPRVRTPRIRGRLRASDNSSSL